MQLISENGTSSSFPITVKVGPRKNPIMDTPCATCPANSTVLPFPRHGHLLLPNSVASLIDLYPTLLNVAGVKHSYAGFATDLRQEDRKHSYKLAQIHPDPMPNDLKIPGSETNPISPIMGPQWCLFDALSKYTYDEKTAGGMGRSIAERSPLTLTEADHLRFQNAMEDLVRSSQYSKHLQIN